MEKVHRGIKEVQVTSDIFQSLRKYIAEFDRAGITQTDLIQINPSTLVLHTYTIKNALNGVGGIKFVNKENMTY